MVMQGGKITVKRGSRRRKLWITGYVSSLKYLTDPKIKPIGYSKNAGTNSILMKRVGELK